MAIYVKQHFLHSNLDHTALRYCRIVQAGCHTVALVMSDQEVMVKICYILEFDFYNSKSCVLNNIYKITRHSCE